MGLGSLLGTLLFFLSLCGVCTGTVPENCKDYKLQFDRVYSVPGDVAMLNSTLVSTDVFNFETIPYNITWYVSKTGREMSNQSGRVLIREETLWFLNVTVDDDGEYVTILRTPSTCYRQATKLVVDLPVTGQCGRPRNVSHTLTNGVMDMVQCPLNEYIKKLNSYNISTSLIWYKGCEPINDEAGMYTYRDTELFINRVEEQHTDSFTCTLKFILEGITGSVSETIDASVTNAYSLVPQVHEPADEVIKAHMGSNFTKRCLVFVPGTEIPFVDIVWWVGDKMIFNAHPSERVYTSEQRIWTQHSPSKGVWLERLLMFTELRENDFNINYTCRAYSSRGHPHGYFTLLPADPHILLPIGSVLVAVTFLFITSVIIYYNFKLDIVLCLRTTFPILYVNKDLDGRIYDAYVAYPEPCEVGFSEEMEKFALETLPQVLENACGYKLFLVGRDSLPGHAIQDSVEENLQASRRLLLLYNASTFSSKIHRSSTRSNNNNNISKYGDTSENKNSKINDNDSYTSFDGSGEVYPDTRQQFECMAAMHRALLEGSLKVILVEMEEITPAQLALFPESVRHLRKKQGAVCWWKNLKNKQSGRTYFYSREDEEKCGQDTRLSPSLSPSSRFWKEMRYHMPVKGKRVVYPKKSALLNL